MSGQAGLKEAAVCGIQWDGLNRGVSFWLLLQDKVRHGPGDFSAQLLIATWWCFLLERVKWKGSTDCTCTETTNKIFLSFVGILYKQKSKSNTFGSWFWFCHSRSTLTLLCSGQRRVYCSKLHLIG